MLKLVKATDPILRTKTEPFNFDGSNDNLLELIPQMIEAMRTNGGIGLAAPQVGLPLRVFVMEIENKEFVCINPVILGKSIDTEVVEEGCLSFPGIKLAITRPKSVIVEYQDPTGKTISTELEGLESRCFQHESDHLNGITFEQKVSKLILNMAKRRQRKIRKEEK